MPGHWIIMPTLPMIPSPPDAHRYEYPLAIWPQALEYLPWK
jgi:hypothetical protein